MDVFVGSFALIRNQITQPCHWLFVERNAELALIEARRLDGDSYREAIEREVGWKLNLRRGRDYLVSHYSRRHFSDWLDCRDFEHPVWFEAEFFVADLFNSRARATVNKNTRCHWLSSDEVRDGCDCRGIPIVDHQSLLLQMTEVIPTW